MMLKRQNYPKTFIQNKDCSDNNKGKQYNDLLNF